MDQVPSQCIEYVRHIKNMKLLDESQLEKIGQMTPKEQLQIICTMNEVMGSLLFLLDLDT